MSAGGSKSLSFELVVSDTGTTDWEPDPVTRVDWVMKTDGILLRVMGVSLAISWGCLPVG